MNTIDLETIKLRLEGIRQAITRSRFTLLVLTITAGAIFVTAWNSYLSWDMGFVSQPHWSHDKNFSAEKRAERTKDIQSETSNVGSAPTNVDPKDLTAVTDFAQQRLADEWIKNRIITVGLLGIRVSVDDLPVLGSLSLWIITIWLFYSVRRENRAIATLLRDSHRLKDWHVRYMVYQGIVHQLVLLDLGRGNRPIADFKTEESTDGDTLPVLRAAVIFLFYLPTVSIFFVVFMDILTLFYFPAPFRPSHEPLWRLLTLWDWIKVGSMEALALALLAFTTFLSYRVRGFLAATERLIKDYRLELKKTQGDRSLSD